MAKFCSRCGRPLADGEVCNCVAEKAAQNEMSQQAAPQMEETASQPNVAQQEAPQQNFQQEAPQQNFQQSAPQPNFQQGEPQQNFQQSAPQQNFQQGGPQPNFQQGGPQQNFQQGAPEQQGMTKEAEWFNKKKDAFVTNTKNVFSQILPMLKSPTEAARNLGGGNSGAVGMELIIIKAVISLIAGLIMMAQLNSNLGGYIELPWFRVILLILISTIAMDCLEAAVLKISTGLFNGRTTFHGMFIAVGERALFDIIILVIVFIGNMISFTLGIILLLIGSVCLITVEFNAYSAIVQVPKDRKVYIFLIAKAVVMIVMFLIFYFIFKGIISDIISDAAGGLLNFLM